MTRMSKQPAQVVMNKAVIYCRKSSEDKDKQILSISDQLQEAQSLAKEKGLSVVASFTEEKSGKESGLRPEFYQMLEMIENGKADSIICWKADRLSRNGTDGGRVIELVDKGLKIVTPQNTYDKNNSILLWVDFGFSTKYSKDLSDNVKRRLKQKAESGVYPSAAPLGYRNTPRRLKGTREILTDKKQFHLCRKWWDLMLTGTHTVESSYKLVEAQGLRGKKGEKISLATGYRMFRNVFYCGLFDYSGQRFQGIHKPMVSMQEFLKVQRLLDAKGNHGRKDDALPFQGMFRCAECGSAITGESHARGRKVFHYYRCTKKQGKCSQSYLNADKMNPQIYEQIEGLRLNPAFAEWIKKVLKRRNAQEFMVAKKQRELITRRIDEIEEKKEVVARLKIDNAISDDKYKARLAELMRDEKALKESYSEDQTGYWLRVVEKTINFAENVRKLFDEGDVYTKQLVLRILGSNIYILNKELKIEAKSQFIFLSSLQNEIMPEMVRLEHAKSPKDGANQGNFEDKFLTVPRM